MKIFYTKVQEKRCDSKFISDPYPKDCYYYSVVFSPEREFEDVFLDSPYEVMERINGKFVTKVHEIARKMLHNGKYFVHIWAKNEEEAKEKAAEMLADYKDDNRDSFQKIPQ